MGRMLAWVGVTLGVVYLVFIGGSWWGIYSPQLRILTMVIATVALCVWAYAATRNASWRPATVMWPAILACLASLGISTVFSRVPRVSLEYLGYGIVLAAMYLLLVRLFAQPFFRRRLAVLATLLFAFTAVAFLVRVGGYWAHWWELLGRIALPPLRPGYEGLTYNNPSAVLTMLALLGAPAAATTCSTSRRGLAACGLILATIGVVAVISGSRAGWLALGLTTAVGAAAWLVPHGNRARLAATVGSVASRRGAKVAVLAAAVVVAVTAAVVVPPILPRLIAGGEPQRIGYAIAAVRIFERSPLVGTGPGTWVIQRPAVTTPAEADYYIPHAHNLELQTLAELGLVGAVAGVVLVANVLWLLRSGARDPDATRRRWAWAGALALLYFVLHQLLDFYANMPAFLFAAAIPVAYLDATTPSVGTGPIPARALGRRGAWVAGLLVAVSVGGLLAQEGPALQQAAAVEAANDRDWAAADAPARAAAAADPEIGSYQLTAGLAAAWAGDHAAAAAYFERAAGMSDLPEAWLNLAAEQAQLGDVGDAGRSLERALRIGYQRPVVAMPAGDLALRLGRIDLADRAFTEVLLRSPSLAADPWWSATAERKSALGRAATAAAAGASVSVAWQLALMLGDTTRASDAAARAADAAFALAVVRAWAGDTAAADSLVAGCLDNPLGQHQLLWCARVEGHRGNVERANRLRDLANVSFQSSYVGGAELRVSDEGMVGRQLMGEPADLWATYTYRRPAPWDILVPSLIHLKLA